MCSTSEFDFLYTSIYKSKFNFDGVWKGFFVINSIKLEAHSILYSTIFNSDSAAGSNEINNGTFKS